MHEVEKPRTDLEITGNRGCLMGSCKPKPPARNLSKKRKISVVAVELGKQNIKEVRESAVVPEPVSHYDAGLSRESVAQLPVATPSTSVEEPVDEIVFDPSVLKAIDAPKPVTKEYTEYTVQAGDTLQKISDKFYGTTRNYMKLYEYNKDSLKSKDSLRVGQKIKIPNL